MGCSGTTLHFCYDNKAHPTANSPTGTDIPPLRSKHKQSWHSYNPIAVSPLTPKDTEGSTSTPIVQISSKPVCYSTVDSSMGLIYQCVVSSFD